MQPSAKFRVQIEQIVHELALGPAQAISSIEVLDGGVASDIAVVTVDKRRFCVKFALPKLKVKAHWTAPVRRNEAEYRWLQFAGSIRPDSVPTLLGRSANSHGFAMQYIEPASAYNYKAALLTGRPDSGQAAQTGATLVAIHAASTRADFDRSQFDNANDFYSIRLEPYLIHSARAHPRYAATLQALSDHIHHARIALTHGDVSPKNLLIGPAGPVFLDAECATFGDPVFDVAFFSNHLLIKAIHMPACAGNLIAAARQFWEHYHAGITWEPVAACEQRLCELLPALMLARVDGKSPVEYLSDPARERLRALALKLLDTRSDRFAIILDTIEQQADLH